MCTYALYYFTCTHILYKPINRYPHLPFPLPLPLYIHIYTHIYSTLLLSYLYIPESPRYLVLKEKYTQASYELNILCNIHTVTPTILYDIYTPTISPEINTTDNNNSNIIHTSSSSSSSAVHSSSASYRYNSGSSVDLWRYPCCRWCSSVRCGLGQLTLDPELRSITLVLAAIWLVRIQGCILGCM